MITLRDLYTVLSAMVPLYAAMILAYGSVRWWKIFTPAQCAGINRFVAVFAVPLLSFHFISSNNPYMMDGPFILADSASKLAILAALAAWAKLSRAGSLDWMITLFSLSTLPNTLVMGIPLLDAMYGPFYGGLMVQLVVLQCIIWYTLMLILFEYRAARLLVMEQFPDTAGSIVSFKVESDVISLDGRGGEPLQTQAEVGDDGKIHVTIRRSTSSRSHAFASPYTRSMPSSKAITPRPSNLTGTDVHSMNHGINNLTSDKQSLISTRPVSPRHSNFTASEEVYSVSSSRGPTPRASNFNEDGYQDFRPSTKAFNSTSPRFHTQPSIPTPPHSSRHIIGQNGLPIPESRTCLPNGNIGKAHSPKALQICKKIADPRASPRLEDDAKELHMFVWSSTNSPISDRGFHMFGGNDYGLANEPMEVRLHVLPSCDRVPNGDGSETMPSQGPILTNEFSFGSKSRVIEDPGSPVDKFPQNIPKSSSVTHYSPKAPGGGENPRGSQPPPTVMLRLILRMVGRKLMHNPNTYSSLIGLTWALIAFRWNIEMPTIVSNSIKILSDAGLGMAMFSLGLFMALQPRLIACGTPLAVFAMAVRFLTGPAIMSAASIAVGLRRVDLHAAIVQAALPQGIVPFVFAREYDLHPDILSTAVIFGMLIALPITLVYYVLLGL